MNVRLNWKKSKPGIGGTRATIRPGLRFTIYPEYDGRGKLISEIYLVNTKDGSQKLLCFTKDEIQAKRVCKMLAPGLGRGRPSRK